MQSLWKQLGSFITIEINTLFGVSGAQQIPIQFLVLNFSFIGSVAHRRKAGLWLRCKLWSMASNCGQGRRSVCLSLTLSWCSRTSPSFSMTIRTQYPSTGFFTSPLIIVAPISLIAGRPVPFPPLLPTPPLLLAFPSMLLGSTAALSSCMFQVSFCISSSNCMHVNRCSAVSHLASEGNSQAKSANW